MAKKSNSAVKSVKSELLTSGQIAVRFGVCRNTVKKYCTVAGMRGNRNLYSLTDALLDLQQAGIRYSRNMTATMHRIRGITIRYSVF